MKSIVSLVVIILFLVGLYYLYKFMYGASASLSSTSLISTLTPYTASSTLNPNAVAVVNMTGVTQGGNYSVSTWVYVASTKANNSNIVHLLDITGGNSSTTAGNTLLFLGLDPLNGTLVVRQSAAGNGDTHMPVTGTTPSSTGYTLSSLISGYLSAASSETPSSFTKDDRCDILNGIEYQRWVLVTVVANGRTLDVYLDGKLSRSCVYNGNNSLGVQTGNAVATLGNRNLSGQSAMTGYFSSTDYYNYALTPDLIWGIYQAGPSTSQTNFFGSLFSTDINLGSISGLNK
jgi:hypothetical protein